MRSGVIMGLLCLFLATGPLDASQDAPSRISGPGGSETGNGRNLDAREWRGDSFVADRRHKADLLRYAKSVLLARLGFAEAVSPPESLLKSQHACFVTFFSGKRVIACFGGFYPRTGNIAEEIGENVRMALLLDTRARSIDRRTALASDVQITFPGEPRPVKSYAEVNPCREGLLVENDRQGAG